MIADSMVCQNTSVYCLDPNEEFTFALQGAGEVYSFKKTCGDFMKANEFDFVSQTELLQQDSAKFEQSWPKGQVYPVGPVTYTNAQGQSFTSAVDFGFSYEIGWHVKSCAPMCYAGDSFAYQPPNCQLQCASEQCNLEHLAPPNHRRMLQTTNSNQNLGNELAGDDITDDVFLDQPLPLAIPTLQLSLEDANISDALLQTYLDSYYRGSEGPSGLSLR